MQKKEIPSALPLYFAAGAFVLGALVFQVYRLSGLLLCTAVAVLAYVVGKKLIPPRVVMVPVPDTIYNTGEQPLDETLSRAEKDLNHLARLNAGIPDETLSSHISRMEKAGRSILDYVAKNPEKARNIRKFAGYYLPTSIRLLSTYAELSATGARGQQAQTLMQTISENAATIATAFEAQLDSLFSDKVLDVSADAAVLETMMKSDGLTADTITQATAQQAQASAEPELKL